MESVSRPDASAAAAPSLLAYHAGPPKGRVTARQVRWGLLWLGLVLVGLGLLVNPLYEVWDGAGMGLYGTPAAPMVEGQSVAVLRAVYAGEVVLYAGAFLLTQWVFLLPRGRLAFSTDARGRPMWRAAAGAAFAAMLLSAGLIATLLDLAGLWGRLTIPGDGRVDGLTVPNQTFGAVWVAMAALWVVWALVFHHLWRNLDHRTAVSRTTRALFAGSIVELLVAVPVQAYAARGEDCYCARGSYAGLVFGATVLLWVFGPGIVLLLLREKARTRRGAKLGKTDALVLSPGTPGEG